MGARKTPRQIVVGFAAETEDVEANARAKLSKKNADFIVGNNVSDGKGFGTDENELLLVDATSARVVGPASKRILADAVLDEAVARL